MGNFRVSILHAFIWVNFSTDFSVSWGWVTVSRRAEKLPIDGHFGWHTFHLPFHIYLENVQIIQQMSTSELSLRPLSRASGEEQVFLGCS